LDKLDTVEIGSTGLRVTRLGIGSAPLAGLFSPVDPEDAVHTVQRAMKMGINYVDTAPLYGHGRSEHLVGKSLSIFPRDDFVLSTKVGRVLEPVQNAPVSPHFANLPRLAPVFDYSRDGILRSLEESLERMGLDRADILYIHDPDEGQSNDDIYDGPNHYKQVIDETLPILLNLRDEGTIKAVGVGMNGCPMLTQFAKDGDFDCFLLAGRYTLLDQTALPELLPLCESKNISVVIGGPYNSGILASDLSPGTTYFYREAPPEVLDRARNIKSICDRYEVPLKAAALQFCLAHPSVAAVIPGARSVQEAEENFDMVHFQVPEDMWSELRHAGMIPAGAPTPGN